MYMKSSMTMAIVMGVIGLTGCGGGDSGPIASAASFPLEASQSSVATTAGSYSATAIDGGNTWTWLVSTTPSADESFEGSSSKVASVSQTLKKNGATASVTSYKSYFSVNPYRSRGARYSDGTYAVQTQPGSYPVSATVGQTGSLGVLTVYTDSTKSVTLRTTESTWSLEPDTSTTAYLCVNSVVKAAGGAVEGTSAGCFRINTAGTVTGIRWTLSVEGKTLVFQ